MDPIIQNTLRLFPSSAAERMFGATSYLALPTAFKNKFLAHYMVCSMPVKITIDLFILILQAKIRTKYSKVLFLLLYICIHCCMHCKFTLLV
jgi:hypothetical protein